MELRVSQDVSKTYTERLRSSLIALISIFLRPMAEVDKTGVNWPGEGERQESSQSVGWELTVAPMLTSAGEGVIREERVRQTGSQDDDLRLPGET